MTSSGWTYQVGSYTVPSDFSVAYVKLYCQIYGATSATVVHFDDGFITAGTQYYHQDQLSNRLFTDVNGNKIGEQGHFPFGESWYASGFSTDLQFTTYERDAESGNDYAVQRNYINRLGRFNAADPLGGDIGDPQTLNRYDYARNNPLTFTDPSGMQPGDGEGGCDDDPLGCIGIGIGVGLGCDICGSDRQPPMSVPPGGGSAPNASAGDPDPDGPFSGPIWQEGGPQIPSCGGNLACMFGIVTPDPFILNNTSLGQTLKSIAGTIRNYLPLCGGTFGFGGLEADLAEGGLFAGGIWESDSKKGNAGGSLIEGWLGGEGPLIGGGKITSPSDTSVLQGFLGFLGLGLNAGPLAGFQVGYVGGKGWGGLYLEGHGAIWAGGTGGYLRSCGGGQ